MSNGAETSVPPYLIEEARSSTRAFRERIVGTSPAAATDYTQTIEGRYVARLVSIRALLTTDANAANRELVLQYRDAGGTVLEVFGAGVVVTASDTVTYYFQRSIKEAQWSVDDSIVVPIADEPLLPTESFRLHIVNAQAADTLTVIRYTVERFYTDDVR